MRVVFGVVAVIGVAYGITKGVMYYRVHNALEELALRASPYGDLEYGAIDTSVSGKVAVSDIVFRPAGVDADVRVAKVRVAGPDAWFFVRPDVLMGGKGASMPPRLHMSAEAISVPVDVEWPSGPPSLDTPTQADTCAGQPASDPELLRSLGLEELIVDAEMGWLADESKLELSGDFAFDVRGLQSMQASFTLADTSLSALQGGQVMPTLGGFELSMRLDPQVGERLVAICAKRLGLKPEAYRERLIAEQRMSAEAAGVRLGPGLQFALDTFYRQWGEVQLVARPQSPLGVMSLAFLPPDRIADQLGLTLRVNDTMVTDLSFTLALGESGSAAGWAALFDDGARSAKPRAVRPRYQRVWQGIAPQTLPQYVSREVRVYSADRPMRTGTLVAVANGVAEVQQRLHGGRYTAHVPLAGVTRAEVEVRKQITAAKTAANSAAQ
jgi:hypothetical protein